MKSKLTFCSLLALSITFISCKKEEAQAETEAVTTNTTQQPIIVPNVQPIPTQTYAQPTQRQQLSMPVQNTTQTVTQTPVVTKPGMNPPHGQPGHRCDIAVGAPLNSPVAKAATTVATPGKPSYTTTTTSTPNPAATTTVGTPEILKTDTPAATAPGMNPPHGQPGHVCGTPVGSPLPKS